MSALKKKLFHEARIILDKNWRGKYTVPSPRLYPHQWSWDSGFISIGTSHYAQGRARQELLSMFEGQWKNGMLPHIIYRGKSGYFPGPDYWQTGLSPHASGITQPPIHGLAAWHVYQNAGDKEEGARFLKLIFPRVLLFHRYLLTRRDPEDSGLATIFHPWESGLDNSLRWDEPLARIRVKGLPEYTREDTEKVAPDQRPSDEDYDRYIYLIEIMKRNRYEEEKVYAVIPFKIKDIVFNSLLYVSNQALLKIAGVIGAKTEEIEAWIRRTRANFMAYFCPHAPDNLLLYDFDIVAGRNIVKRTAASLVSLCTDLLAEEQAETMASWMKHSHMCKEDCVHQHPVIPSVSMDSLEFNPLNYWRGPVWMNINWMLYLGMKNYGFYDDAGDLKKSIMDLVGEHGFYEYYNPLSGKGLGAGEFSWTAALLIDLISEKGD